jgi:predicted  nucleic acid-binding Zn-ribbon protein
MENFEDNILLRLRRKYSENEALKLALLELATAKAELSKERIENGKLKAEIAYFENEITELKKLVIDEDKIHLHPLYKALHKSQQKLSQRAHEAEYKLAVLQGTVRQRI